MSYANTSPSYDNNRTAYDTAPSSYDQSPLPYDKGRPSYDKTPLSHDKIDLSWEAVPASKSYVIEQSADPPTDTSWGHASVSTRSSYTIDGLKSGTRYWFRVAAVNGVGQSGWSDPSMKIAP